MHKIINIFTIMRGAKLGAVLVLAIALTQVPTISSTLTAGNGTVFAATTCGDGKVECPKLEPQKITSTCPKGQCLIDKYIQPAVNLLAGLVGLAVTISIIMAGIRYATSADSPQKVSEAKQRLVTSIFVLIGFFTFYALMNYLIPGGLR
jgi:Type IV secretion system pilin